jgi:hypothetical protein
VLALVGELVERFRSHVRVVGPDDRAELVIDPRILGEDIEISVVVSV